MINAPQIADEIYEQGFCLIENFLAEEHYQALCLKAKALQEQGEFRGAKIGQALNATKNSHIRSDQIVWLEEQTEDSALKAYLAKVSAIADELNQSLFLGLADFESHFAIYEAGAFYKKHIDQFAHNKDRRISSVYYLNNAWQESFGGELNLYKPNGELLKSIVPLANRFICFNSELVHEVCETKQSRYSLAGWLRTTCTYGKICLNFNLKGK